MKDKQIFDALTHNAFDFLTRAVADLETSPKYSVIHFCAAVEMLLKAKLMREHWSLVVSKPQEASRVRFEAGDFASVTLAETRTRLREVAGVEISEPAWKSFDALSKHRNKMIHFYHSGVSGDSKEKERIATEQYLSWHYLHGLLQQWKSDFAGHQKEIQKAEAAMRGHRKYLAAKFKALGDEIKAQTASGVQVEVCDSCGYEAAVLKPFRKHIFLGRCLVCDHSGTQVEVECPGCSESLMLTESYVACPECGKDITPEKVLDALVDPDKAHYAARSGDDNYNNINCDHCDGYHTVLPMEDKYLCCNCLGVFDQVQPCGWCNELNTGDMSDSYSVGCSHCEGWIGHQKDD